MQCILLSTLAGLLTMAAASCSPMNGDAVKLDGAGRVLDVLEGVAPPEDAWIDLGAYRAAFEAGSPRSVDSIGEFISFNGIGYARSTHPDDLNSLLIGRRILTNAAVFLPLSAKPQHQTQISEPISLMDFVKQMTEMLDGPVCFTGIVTFAPMRSTAIQRAPVRGEHIFYNSDLYYPRSPVITSSVVAAIMGCATPMQTDASRNLDVVVYQNPNDALQEVLSHTHAASLTSVPSQITEIRPEHVVQVHHVFTDSVITSGYLEVYKIESIRQIQ